MKYHCRRDNRRSELLQSGTDLNGIDFLEVAAPTGADSSGPVLLRVHFIKTPSPTFEEQLLAITPDKLFVTGGERIRDLRVTNARFVKSGAFLEVEVDRRGDFSVYTFSLRNPETDAMPAGLDSEMASVEFSFRLDCPSPFDCAPTPECRRESTPPPDIDRLAKDYESFRRLLLDRMAGLLPAWRERNPADLGVTLVELLAYVGDQLSYHQDAVATEAYLGTARQRASVRRHARLLDYPMRDGCNARAWLHIRLKEAAPNGPYLLPRALQKNGDRFCVLQEEPVPSAPNSTPAIQRTRFSTRLSGECCLKDELFGQLVAERSAECFEPLESVFLYRDHNQFEFHTWSRDECCLPRGATRATLRGSHPDLAAGDVLVLMERVGSLTGHVADADPTHRHAVRLSRVWCDKADAAPGHPPGARVPLTDPVTGDAITEIEWFERDALPFPLRISIVTELGERLDNVGIALGNIVLVDHGQTVDAPEPLGSVPQLSVNLAPVEEACCHGRDTATTSNLTARFQPRLRSGPLTQIAATPGLGATGVARLGTALPPTVAAADAVGAASRNLPAIRLGDNRGRLWTPQGDLLSSDAFATEFVVEADNSGRASLRFGDDENGLRPGAGTEFFAVYRVGNGASGNVGAGAIVHAIGDALGIVPEGVVDGRGSAVTEKLSSHIESVWNPLAAQGGAEPEGLDDVRHFAPQAFRSQRRAVTSEDYARTAESHPHVQRAVAELRWTGSWPTVFLAVDRWGGRPVDSDFEDALRAHLAPWRMAGHDLEIVGPRHVSVELELLVCVEPDYFRGDVLGALMDVFGAGIRRDGSRGFFHPDNFTFGSPVRLSEIYAAAHRVPGVGGVEVTVLRRLGDRISTALADGRLSIGAFEIARLADDGNFPERGQKRFVMRGGR